MIKFRQFITEDTRLDYDLLAPKPNHRSLLDLHMNIDKWHIPDRDLKPATMFKLSSAAEMPVHYEDVGMHEIDEKLPKKHAKNLKHMIDTGREIQHIRNIYSHSGGGVTYIHFLDGHKTPYVSAWPHQQFSATGKGVIDA